MGALGSVHEFFTMRSAATRPTAATEAERSLSYHWNFPQWSQWNQWGNAPFAPCHGTLPRMHSAASHSPRNDRIAHFPPVIRPELDERLAANERGQPPVKWLNPLPDAGGIPALLAGG